MVLGGRLVRGAHGLPGQLGQIPFPGERLEDVASGFGVARAAGVADARAAVGHAAISEAVALLARGVVAMQAIVDPEVMVIGGGLGLSDGFIARLEAALRGHPAALRPCLVAAGLGGDAGLVGAADHHGLAA